MGSKGKVGKSRGQPKARKQRSKKRPSAARTLEAPALALDRSRELSLKELSWTCPDLEELGLPETEEAPSPKEQRRLQRRAHYEIAPEDFVGQERAREGLRLGLSMAAPGYHIFVTGPEGSGRRSLVKATAASLESPFPKARDRVLVHDFQSGKPILLTLPRGKGRRFKQDMDDLFELVSQRIRLMRESDEWLRRRELFQKHLDRKEKDLFHRVLDQASAQNFSIPNPTDGEVLFVLDRHRYTRSRLEAALKRGTIKLPHKRRRFKEHEALSLELQEAQQKARALLRQAPKQLRQMEKSLIDRCVAGYLADLREQYPTEAAKKYFDSYLLGILQNLDFFAVDEDEEVSVPYPFQVNLLVDSREIGERAQGVLESSGSLKSLFGSLDAERPAGDAPEFLKLRAGAFLEHDGGVILLDARQLNTDSPDWKALRHCLLEGRVSLPSTLSALDCALSCKVVIVGSEEDFHELVQCEDLQDVFKIKIEMETSVVASVQSARALAASFQSLAIRSGHRRLSLPALTKMLEHAARVGQGQGHLSLLYGQFLDLIREAEIFSKGRDADAEEIDEDDIYQALKARKERQSLHERQTQALISNGIVLIDSKGERVGQVNALVVYENGEQSFARPCRITATVSVGWKGLIDIERESALSGETHHKGVQIISGLLRSRYGRKMPLMLTASLCFEQSYSPIDGDSASAAEVIAVLSALAGVPIHQSMAISGSINQLGDLQAVGGINEKVEGFYDACLKSGLTGDQGVLIPEANVQDLNLREDVIASIKKGQFHVYSAKTLDGALERLLVRINTKMKTPDLMSDFHSQVETRLLEFAQAWKSFKREN